MKGSAVVAIITFGLLLAHLARMPHATMRVQLNDAI
jgi:hypothetical protein